MIRINPSDSKKVKQQKKDINKGLAYIKKVINNEGGELLAKIEITKVENILRKVK